MTYLLIHPGSFARRLNCFEIFFMYPYSLRTRNSMTQRPHYKKVDDDIVTAIDSGHSVILVLLDLSVAFDTVDHTILIRRLSTRFGIRGGALDWFVSYLSDRTQYVKVNDTSSNSLYLTQGVPQGSVLGPILYSSYTSPSNVK